MSLLSVVGKSCLNRSSSLYVIHRNLSDKHYKVVVAGGGAGGLAVAGQLSRTLGKNDVAIVEPSKVHYYQPMWTFVGAGICKLSESAKPMKELIPSKCTWVQEGVIQFIPDENCVKLTDNNKLHYDYLVVALGNQMDLDKVKGLREALKTDKVCSNYMSNTVENTWKCIQNFSKGNAVFTFPNTPIKCAGAPQKIMYLMDDHLRRTKKRDSATIIYNTALPVIFSAPKYAEVLRKICEKRGLNVNYKHNLVEVVADKQEAVFEVVDSKERKTIKYDMLHVAPPQKPAEVLKPIADQAGYVEVNKESLQHVKHKNIFALGDCSNLPTSKTAAAVAAQSGVLTKNLKSIMEQDKANIKYTGYTSCPLITSYKTCVLAEFDYTLEPRETFPINQRKERRIMYFLTKNVMPLLYWNLMPRGFWKGPGVFRKLFHPLSK